MSAQQRPDLGASLIRTHKSITRGLNVSLNRGQDFAAKGFSSPELRAGYALYVRALMDTITGHHLSEDEVGFPFFRDRIPTLPVDRLMADHRTITGILKDMEAPVRLLAAGDNAEAIKGVVSGLNKILTIWTPHIAIEQSNLTTANVDGVASFEKQAELLMQFTKHTQENAGPMPISVPFFLYNLEPSDRAAIAAMMPAEVMEKLIPGPWKAQWAPMMPFLLE